MKRIRRKKMEKFTDLPLTHVDNNINLQEITMKEDVQGAGDFIIKDSGKREHFDSGMVRDIQEGKIDFTRIVDGPMFDRWAQHLTTGAKKYPDIAPGVPNWMMANSNAENTRFRKSAFRHFVQWFKGDRDEDHAAAVFFNINGAEYIRDAVVNPGTEG